MIRVQVRAWSAVVRAGLESLLQNHPSLRVMRSAFDGDDAADDGTGDVAPDVIVAELDGRDDDALAGVRNAAVDGIPVVLLVPGSAVEWADMLRRGVRAILPTNATGSQIAAATEAAAAGLVVLHPAEVETLLHTPQPATEAPAALPEVLTAREIGVLRLLAEGLANKEIASRLELSEHTVKFHVASIMGKLGAASRTEAVMLGIRHGIVLI